MRRDIEIHIHTGDIVIGSLPTEKLRLFQWVVNEKGLSRYIYGEIEVPGSIAEARIKTDGVYFTVPYTPIFKEVFIRIKRNESFLQNPTDGGEWFRVQTCLYGGEIRNVYASQLGLISENRFYLRLEKDIAYLYSGDKSDMNIIPANRQNSNLLLKCIPTNHYRYPLTGVGLIRWMNSNIEYTQLATVLQKEFEADGVSVRNASFDCFWNWILLM